MRKAPDRITVSWPTIYTIHCPLQKCTWTSAGEATAPIKVLLTEHLVDHVAV